MTMMTFSASRNSGLRCLLSSIASVAVATSAGCRRPRGLSNGTPTFAVFSTPQRFKAPESKFTRFSSTSLRLTGRWNEAGSIRSSGHDNGNGLLLPPRVLFQPTIVSRGFRTRSLPTRQFSSTSLVALPNSGGPNANQIPLITTLVPPSTPPITSPIADTRYLTPTLQEKLKLEPEYVPLPTDPEAYQEWLGAWKSALKRESKLEMQKEIHGGMKSGMEGTLKVVAIAMAANFFMFLLKAWAAYHSGSSAMVSEALHSLADSLNQCLLAWGIYRSMQTPDPEHPYGFQSERYAWALVSGVGIFFLGGGVSIQHGIHGLMHPEPLGHVGTAVGVLIANFAVDGYSMKTAYKEIKEKAGEQGLKPMEYLRKGGDPTTSAVFYEDLAALSGVVIALGALGMSHVTASPFWDSVGSITIGGVLAWVAVNLIKKNIDGLVGTSMAPRKLNAIVEAIKKDPVVISVHDVKTVARGSTWARFKAEINFDGAQIVRRYRERLAMTSSQLPAEAVQQLNFGVLRKDDGFESEEECQRWLEAHGRGILEQVGLEIDRVEKIVFEMAPEVKHVDIEVL